LGRIIAYCGLDCSQCDGYRATQAGDVAAKEQVAARWRMEYNNPHVDAVYVTCDGCTAADGRLGGHCSECDIRICGTSRGLGTCADCAGFETCEKLARFFGFVPAARETLMELKQGRAG
jgi:hypothetical protein